MWIVAVALGTGCDWARLRAARLLEAAGRPAAALRQYERADSCEAHVRAAEIYRSTFQRCLEARRHEEAVLRACPGTEWAARAQAGLLSCPDFFPLDPGRIWTYGDSGSVGRAMRQEWKVESSSGPAAAWVSFRRFAGERLNEETKTLYGKSGWALWREDGPGRRTIILRYPFAAGQNWKIRGPGGVFRYRIESDSAEAKTAAGVFSGCLKVRETNPKFPGSWRYDYYAPFVGRVRTTVAGPGYENPIVELLSRGP